MKRTRDRLLGVLTNPDTGKSVAIIRRVDGKVIAGVMVEQAEGLTYARMTGELVSKGYREIKDESGKPNEPVAFGFDV